MNNIRQSKSTKINPMTKIIATQDNIKTLQDKLEQQIKDIVLTPGDCWECGNIRRFIYLVVDERVKYVFKTDCMKFGSGYINKFKKEHCKKYIGCFNIDGILNVLDGEKINE